MQRRQPIASVSIAAFSQAAQFPPLPGVGLVA